MNIRFFMPYMLVGVGLIIALPFITHFVVRLSVWGPSQFTHTSSIHISQNTDHYNVPAQIAPQEYHATHRVNFDYLNVRAAPTIFTAVTHTLAANTEVLLFEKTSLEWCKIIVPPPHLVHGFVACRYLSPL